MLFGVPLISPIERGVLEFDTKDLLLDPIEHKRPYYKDREKISQDSKNRFNPFFIS